MEHPRALLMLVLKRHYKNKPEMVDYALKLIKDYTESEEKEYGKILNTLYQTMGDLPPDILLYFLTLIPVPQDQQSSTSYIVELMKQMHTDDFQNSMRPILLEYLNNSMPKPAPPAEKKKPAKPRAAPAKRKPASKPKPRAPPKKRAAKGAGKRGRKAKKKGEVVMQDCQSLSEICAKVVLGNWSMINRIHRKRKKYAESCIRQGRCHQAQLDRLNAILTDANKKITLMHEIAKGKVPFEVVRDYYGDHEIFYREKNLHTYVSEDILVPSKSLITALDTFFTKLQAKFPNKQPVTSC